MNTIFKKAAFAVFKYSLFLFIVSFTQILNAQQSRNWLSANETYSSMSIHHIFPEKKELKKNIEGLSEQVKKSIISDAEEYRGTHLQTIPLTSYLDYKRSGDRKSMEKYWSKRLEVLRSLVLAETLEDDKRYIDDIVNTVWAICEQSSWVLSAHLVSQKGGGIVPNIKEHYIDLGAGEVASTLAWTYYLFKTDFDEISPYINQRIIDEIKTRIIRPYLENNDFWWMGLNTDFVNNWNPWCNYNVILSTVLLGENINEDTRTEIITKSMKSVDQFINYYKEDGACEEGPAYWSHAAGKMLDYLSLLKKVYPSVDLGDKPLIKNMGNYIKDVHIAENYFVNFADSPVQVKPDPGLVFRYGEYIKDKELRRFGAYLADEQKFLENPLGSSLDASLKNILIYDSLKFTQSNYKNISSFWYGETELVGGNSSLDEDEGFFFAAKGGFNDESHNHNDAGSFILFYNGQPLIVDAGVETYSAKTFSDERYDIWTMQSDYHNLPMVNGFSQEYGDKYKAQNVIFKNTSKKLEFGLDISAAYPDEAACTFWKRTFSLEKRGTPKFIIEEDYELSSNQGDTKFVFLLTHKPIIKSSQRLILQNKGGKQVYLNFPNSLQPDIQKIDLTDEKLQASWEQNSLYRLVFTNTSEALRNKVSFEIIEKF